MTEYRWIDLGDGRQVYRRVKARADIRSGLAMPMIARQFDRPVQSMADGKYYDTPRDLERTYKANGNPMGQEFVQLGNEKLNPPEVKADPRQRREHIRQAIRDVKSGNVPPEIQAIT